MHQLRRRLRTADSSASRSGRQRGQAAVEYVGVLTLLLVVALAVAQLGIAVYVAQQASTASRSAARVASDTGQQGQARAVARESMSGWVADNIQRLDTSSGFDDVTVTIKVKIPSLLPMLNFGSVEKHATMPRDGF
ncbi:TadE/TadG family type IV pilus assembly protein [Streptomyces sp. NBC_00338]|uniref:TadE/TadG family type IV pilus assembly protein n=1 Tax=unclassified Streptomyces TaxID=2593676 RepID=UPI00225BBC55|nr:TadE/TadG family type IV pilus assembly protein [Streptomyces sp. NBC_00338]MCX5142535.1 pilus assembly protein [Streptomyces sp. NBC_00338]WSU63866.1 pilus assembly protein [Streptomyces sp. NBC_01104]